MIEGKCGCGTDFAKTEGEINQPFACSKCQKVITALCAESLTDGSGAGDFDAVLRVHRGPSRVGEQFFLGGVPDILIGKLPDRQIQLVGTQVSRAHAKLSRIDFGPSRWKIDDNKSTNGIYVNGARVTSQELQPGDMLKIGEFELEFQSHFQAEASAPVTSAAAPSAPAGGPVCPSCEQSLAKNAKFCIPCGINIQTGRPLLTAHQLDENVLYGNAQTFLRLISIVVPLTPLPIPIRSEAIGVTKPYTIWTIAAITVLASILFFIASANDRQGTRNWMLWSPYAKSLNLDSLKGLKDLDPQVVDQLVDEMTPREQAQYRAQMKRLKGTVPESELRTRAMLAMIEEELASRRGEFHPYQLITHAFLHDNTSIYGFIMHLAGNLLFMLVFGTRVNALIGNIATAVIYPILAIAAAEVYLHMMGARAMGPMLGASGAIMGLAGMYLILFPVQQVYCAMWIRLRGLFGLKIFALRGFWVLLIYFAYDALMNLLPGRSGVAHWAHIGGFLTGMLIALGILFSRMVNCRGNDMLSVILGKHAWGMIGKPSRWIQAAITETPRAVSMSYPQ